METAQLKMIIEAILLAAGRPLTLDQLLVMFEEQEKPERAQVREAVAALQEDYAGRGIDLVEVGSGYRIQVRADMQPWVSRLWEEKPARYTRALLETLALIAYRQPVTRGEIEEVRGVSVSSNIIKTLQEREWIHVVGHREVPGRPAMYGTTRHFLDYFSLKTLDELPSLAELRDLNEIGRELEFDMADIPGLQVEDGDAEEPAEAAAEAEEALPVAEPAVGESGATIH